MTVTMTFRAERARTRSIGVSRRCPHPAAARPPSPGAREKDAWSGTSWSNLPPSSSCWVARRKAGVSKHAMAVVDAGDHDIPRW